MRRWWSYCRSGSTGFVYRCLSRSQLFVLGHRSAAGFRTHALICCPRVLWRARGLDDSCWPCWPCWPCCARFNHALLSTAERATHVPRHAAVLKQNKKEAWIEEEQDWISSLHSSRPSRQKFTPSPKARPRRSDLAPEPTGHSVLLASGKVPRRLKTHRTQLQQTKAVPTNPTFATTQAAAAAPLALERGSSRRRAGGPAGVHPGLDIDRIHHRHVQHCVRLRTPRSGVSIVALEAAGGARGTLGGAPRWTACRRTCASSSNGSLHIGVRRARARRGRAGRGGRGGAPGHRTVRGGQPGASLDLGGEVEQLVVHRVSAVRERAVQRLTELGGPAPSGRAHLLGVPKDLLPLYCARRPLPTFPPSRSL